MTCFSCLLSLGILLLATEPVFQLCNAFHFVQSSSLRSQANLRASFQYLAFVSGLSFGLSTLFALRRPEA